MEPQNVAVVAADLVDQFHQHVSNVGVLVTHQRYYAVQHRCNSLCSNDPWNDLLEVDQRFLSGDRTVVLTQREPFKNVAFDIPWRVAACTDLTLVWQGDCSGNE